MKNIINLSEEQIKKIEMINPEEIECAYLPGPEENELIESIKNRHGVHYHQLIWKMTGDFSANEIIDGYNNLVYAHESLRSNYFANICDTNLCVTFVASKRTVSITDISYLPWDKQMSKIITIASAQTRSSYNPERSAPLRMHVLILSENAVAVICSFVPELCKSVSKNDVAKYVFPRMTFTKGELDVIANTAKSFNQNIRRENIDYWRQETAHPGKALLFPGQFNNLVKTESIESSYKAVDSKIYKKISEYCAQKTLSKKTVFMYCYLMMLGVYNDETNPSVAVIGNYGQPDVYPVSINCEENMQNMLSLLDEKILNASDYGYLNEEDVKNIFTENWKKHYYSRFYLLDIDKMHDSDNWTMLKGNGLEDGVNISVRFDFSRSDCFISYTYRKSVFNNEVIEKLHNKYLDFVETLLDCGKVSFDSGEFEDIEVNEEERKRQLLTKVVSGIKGSAIFKTADVAFVKKMAAGCRIVNVSVDDEILSANDVFENLGLIISGKIEESVASVSGMDRTLRIMSEKEVIGFESLVGVKTAKRNYIVASDEAIIMWIPIKVVETLLIDNPQMLKSALRNVYERLWKVENIWLME